MNTLDTLLGKYPRYRTDQVKQFLFQNLVKNWNDAFSLPKDLRQELSQKINLGLSVQNFFSEDKKTIKTLITWKDGLQTETVLMRHEDGRNTVCVSCQVGCAMNCAFCATGKMGFKRDLTSWEIISQVLHFARLLESEKEKVTNIVYMGMGEPFQNYNEVMNSIYTLHDPQGFNLGARHFSVSTCGIIEGIEKLSQEKLDINLAISLHAPSQELRQKLMPITQKYPLSDLMLAIKDYLKLKNRKVMFEYVMLKNINDGEEEARQLAKLLKGMLCMVNLIRYNDTGEFQASDSERIKKFKEILKNARIEAVQRYHFGSKIKAACGQLVASGK